MCGVGEVAVLVFDAATSTQLVCAIKTTGHCTARDLSLHPPRRTHPPAFPISHAQAGPPPPCRLLCPSLPTPKVSPALKLLVWGEEQCPS